MKTKKLSIMVAGATGRMGQSVRQAIFECQESEVSALLAYEGHQQAGMKLYPEELPLYADFSQAYAECFSESRAEFSSVVIDFSLPQGCVQHVQSAARHGVPIVIGTTGFSEEQNDILHKSAQKTPVFWAPNMSLGIALLRRLVQQAAASLPKDFNIEIIESHHRFKQDNPSGTAIALGKAAAHGRGIDHDEHAQYNRKPQEPARLDETIGYAVVRAGGIIGNHQVIMASQSEQVELGHRALDRGVFAVGALRAAQWLVDQKAGFYGMDDLLDHL